MRRAASPDTAHCQRGDKHVDNNRHEQLNGETAIQHTGLQLGHIVSCLVLGIVHHDFLVTYTREETPAEAAGIAILRHNRRHTLMHCAVLAAQNASDATGCKSAPYMLSEPPGFALIVV